MKKYLFPAFAVSVILLEVFVVLQCGKDNSTNPGSSVKLPSELDKEIAGVWRFSLPYNQDTTFHIVLSFDSAYDYKINVNINDVDTVEREKGTWYIVSDTVSKADTVWMVRGHCHQINLQTQTLDSIDCGVDTAGIKLNISKPASKTIWIIPLNDFVKYMPPDILPAGVTLPPGQFVKD